MKRTVVLLVCLILCVPIMGYTQEDIQGLVQPVLRSIYSVEFGKHIYYMQNQTLEVLGHNFASNGSWGINSYVTLHLPKLDFTYTYKPMKLYTSGTDILLAESCRGDLELDYGLPFRPLVILEWLGMDMFTLDYNKENDVFISKRDIIQRINGGLGITSSFPMTPTLSVKGGIAAKLINQRGWEFAAGLHWKAPNILMTEPRLTIGMLSYDLSADWGKSSGFGLFGEIGFNF